MNKSLQINGIAGKELLPDDLERTLKARSIHFIIEPYIRFKGLPGEQATMFFLDPPGNALEFKAFQDISQLFVK
ncbi:MAG TPA: hypothetical protein VF939_21690 [Puia sp.]